MFFTAPIENSIALKLFQKLALKIEKDYGSLEIGKFADIQIRNSDNYKNVVYKFGVNEVEHVIKNGKIIF